MLKLNHNTEAHNFQFSICADRHDRRYSPKAGVEFH